MEGSRIEGSGSRAHALRLQRLIADIRDRDDAPSTHETRTRGPSPAERSAQHMGIGDNLKAALTDVHTQSNPTAPTFADQHSADAVVGDGNIDPGLAFASMPTSRDVQLGSSRAQVSDPLTMAKETSSSLASSGVTATVSHSGLAGGTLFGPR